MTFMHLT